MFKFLNQSAWLTEIFAGALMLYPVTAPLGGLLIALSFAWIATQIRLGYLCHMVIAICLIYFRTGNPFVDYLDALGKLMTYVRGDSFSVPLGLQSVMAALILTHMVLMPFVYLGMWWNLKAKKRLSIFLQKSLNVYSNFFGMIIWRVFSSDITNFVVQIQAVSATGQIRCLSEHGRYPAFFGYRFSQVVESITLACLFTTLKYYPQEKSFFFQKLIQYARTLGVSSGEKICLELYRIVKRESCFSQECCARYEVDPIRKEIKETLMEPDWFRPAEYSIMNPGKEPGSYAP